jgi:hypothetical protein
MSGGAIPTTGRRTIHPAWEFISLRTQPAPLRCALALRVSAFARSSMREQPWAGGQVAPALPSARRSLPAMSVPSGSRRII